MPIGLPLDLDTLVAPIAGGEQAGSSSTYLELRATLDDLRKEVNPEDFDADDPTRPDKPKFADWRRIEELTRKALAQDAKDLRLAGYLVEAARPRVSVRKVARRAAATARNARKCWDCCYPGIEDGDVEARVGVFNALDDLNTKGRVPFPNFLRMLPVVVGGGRKLQLSGLGAGRTEKGGRTGGIVRQGALQESDPKQEHADDSGHRELVAGTSAYCSRQLRHALGRSARSDEQPALPRAWRTAAGRRDS